MKDENLKLAWPLLRWRGTVRWGRERRKISGDGGQEPASDHLVAFVWAFLQFNVWPTFGHFSERNMREIGRLLISDKIGSPLADQIFWLLLIYILTPLADQIKEAHHLLIRNVDSSWSDETWADALDDQRGAKGEDQLVSQLIIFLIRMISFDQFLIRMMAATFWIVTLMLTTQWNSQW